jgi:transcriptional regulator with XRE-family HTH domain
VPTIGSQIKKARLEAGFKNAERLAVAMDVSFSTLQRWEQGQTTPSVSRLIEISKLTEKPLSFFIAGNEEAAVA